MLAEFSRVVNLFDTYRQDNFVTYNFIRHVKGSSMQMQNVRLHLNYVTLVVFG